MNIIAPFFLILASVGIFYGYIDPNYRGKDIPNNVVNLMAERKQYRYALENFNNLINERNKKVEKNNNFSSNDLDRLKKLLPDHIDNVRLIIDIDNIASRYGLGIKNIKVNNESEVSSGGKLIPDKSSFGTFTMKFKILAKYDEFRSFINDLQESLRIVDISSISFESKDSDEYDYEVTIKTYWIK